jgi:hypothetical protein
MGVEKMRDYDKGKLKSLNFALIFIFFLMVFPIGAYAVDPDDADANGAGYRVAGEPGAQVKQPHMNYYEFDREIINQLWEVPQQKYYAIEYVSVHLTRLSGAYPPVISIIVDNSVKIVLPLETASSGGTINRYMFNEKILMFAWNTVFVQSDSVLSGTVLITGYLFDSQ